jgi:hypothetical protein
MQLAMIRTPEIAKYRGVVSDIRLHCPMLSPVMSFERGEVNYSLLMSGYSFLPTDHVGWLNEFPGTLPERIRPIPTVAGLIAEGLVQFMVDLDMSMAAPGEWDSEIAVGVVARDRSHAAEVALLLAYQICPPYEAVACAAEDIDSPDVHPDHPFDVNWRNVAVYAASVH